PAIFVSSGQFAKGGIKQKYPSSVSFLARPAIFVSNDQLCKEGLKNYYTKKSPMPPSATHHLTKPAMPS
ncbi:MAG: hypothetical protein U1C55_11455, partial [Smithellaceae bacterium]|nr:hypothetical protein [Smithellaceae bacterium]